jgi:hypothetical protein
MTISRSQQPRQMYGLGSLVKSVKKAVKNVVKSPLGKAALLYGATLPFGGPMAAAKGLGGFFMGGKTLPPEMGFKSKGLFGTLASKFGGMSALGKAGVIGGASLLGGLFAGKTEEEIEELKRNPETLKVYLRDYYTNLNPNASSEEVEAFVKTNTAEYYATGGRVGYGIGGPGVQIGGPPPLGSAQGASPLYQNVLQYLQRGRKQAQPAAPRAKSPAPATSASFSIEDPRSIAVSNLAELGYDVDRFMDVGAPPSMSSGPQMIGPGGMMPNITFKDQETLEKLMNPAFDFQQGDYISLLREAKDIGRDYTIDEALKLSKEDIMEISDLYAKKHKYGKYAPVSPSSRYTGPTSFTYGGGQTGVATPTFKKGGRAGYKFGDVVDQASGIMGLPKRTNSAGVKELDLRKSGGFIPPVGVKEKADDIPAMLSNNEFVFTADAVRGMGDGDVNKGAQRMYTMMKRLEKGGRV